MPPIPQLVADKIARELDIDVDDIGICHACLSFVSFALDEGDEREIRLWTNRITPDLWDEGLALPVRLALKRAGATDALAEPSKTADAVASRRRSSGA